MKQIERFHYLESKHVELWVQNGVIHQIFKPGAELELEDLQRLVEDRMKVSEGRLMPAYVDLRQLLFIDPKAMEYAASKEATALLTAAAFHVDNIMNKLLFNIYSDSYAPGVPVKPFACYEQALQWLEYYKRIN